MTDKPDFMVRAAANYGYEPQQILCVCDGYGGEIHEYGSDSCIPYWAEPKQSPVSPDDYCS